MQPLIDLINYEVSEDGRVFSKPRSETFFSLRHNDYLTRVRNGKEKTQSVSNTGYKTVSICNGGLVKRCSVHRLVAMCYVPNPLNLPEVNHKDGDRFNNHFSNLEWVTRKDNALHSTRVLGKNRGSLSGTAKLTEEGVRIIKQMLDKGHSQTEIAKIFYVTNHAIFRIAKGYNWKHVTGIGKEGVNGAAAY